MLTEIATYIRASARHQYLYIQGPSKVVHLHTSAFTPSLSSPLQTILLRPNPTGTPTTTAPARTSHLTILLACARCSSLIVWPSTRRCSIPSFVDESSEMRWPKEAFPREGLCWALAQDDSSMGARFFWEYGREVCGFDAWIRGRMELMGSLRGKQSGEGSLVSWWSLILDVPCFGE